ncbi:MAG: Gfo/Idh/MocA family oxidoreductase [Planctomycetes bacterium]|nr:Gfo/Idh/MocA family oxidoreductase [Planctomycetota bacterium]
MQRLTTRQLNRKNDRLAASDVANRLVSCEVSYMRFTAAPQAIERALATGQIGVPVSVRLIAHLADDPSEIAELKKLIADKALTWLDDAAASVFEIENQSQQSSQLIRTATGRSALVSAGLCLENEPLVEVVVFGTRGVVSWEAGQSVGWAELAKESHPTQQANAQLQPTVDRDGGLSPPYGVLLISGDHTHQPGYAEALMAGGRCKLIGVTDEDDISDSRHQLNQRLADRLEIPLLPNLSVALARKDVDIVSVCAEPFRRGRVIVQAAQAGKHLYLDKPLAGSVEDSDAILAAVRESGVVAHMFTQVHWDPAQRVRAIVESGELGDLVAVHCDVCFAKGQGGTADLSRPRIEHESPDRFELPDAKRELTNVGVYPVAMLLWLLRQEVKRVHATTGNFFFVEHQSNDMEDFGQMMLEFDGGVTATISAGRAGWRSHPGFGLHRVCLIGTKASMTVDAHRPRVEVWADGEPWTAPQRDPDDPMGMWAPLPDSPYRADPKNDWVLPATSSWATDAKHFLDCIEQGRRSDVSVDVAAAASEILFAAYRSAASGATIELPLSR